MFNFQIDGPFSYIPLMNKGFLPVKIFDFAFTILFIPRIYLEFSSSVMNSSLYFFKKLNET